MNQLANPDQFLWPEKYRPKVIGDIILPDHLKKTFQTMADGSELQNMLFTGRSGRGKTTVAIALCETLNLDWIKINGSDERNIDTLRSKIRQFASTISLQGGYKVVILDEADYLNAQSTQPALRAFMEDFSDNCRFILTCNHKHKIKEALHSRCTVIDFDAGVDKKELAKLQAQFMKRLMDILNQEQVTYKKDDVANIIMTYGPDWRRVLNETQRAVQDKALVPKTVASVDAATNELVDILKQKNFTKLRKWVVEVGDIDSAVLYRNLYEGCTKFCDTTSQAQLVLILAEYQYKEAFVADVELNTVACLTEVMASVKFND